MEKKNEPTITVMGEDITSPNKPSRSAGDIIWGVFLILVGTLLLFSFMEVLPWEFWQHVWRFWPVLIILAGLHVVLGDNIISRFIMLIVALLVFTFVIAVGIAQTNLPLADSFPPEVHNLIESWEGIKR